MVADIVERKRSDPKEQYLALVRSLRRTKGFGIEFLECSPAQARKLIEQVKKDLPQKQVGELNLDQSSDSLLRLIKQRPDCSELNILFVLGIEKSLEPYIRPGYGGFGDYYNLDTVPPILAHLNLQRENFRDQLGHICLVFIVPLFALRYISRRAPDFYDWRNGVYKISDDFESVFTRTQETQHFPKNYIFHGPLNYNFYESFLEHGNKLFNLGQYEAAIASYDKAVAIKPDYHEAWNNRGIALGNLGQYEAAIASYDKAVAIKPDKREAWYNRGVALGNLGQYEAAIASYDKAVAIKPDDHEAWNNRGVALGNLGQYEAAIASYDKAVAIEPDDHEAWNNRGVALGNLGQYEAAIANYDKALAIKPDDHEAWGNRGVALGNLGQYEAAIASYDKAAAIKPDDPNILYSKGCCYSKQGDTEQAITYLQQAIQLDSDYREMAKTDSDFDPIRHDERFRMAIRN